METTTMERNYEGKGQPDKAGLRELLGFRWFNVFALSDSIYFHPYGYSYAPYGDGVPVLIMIDLDTRSEYTGRLPAKGELGTVAGPLCQHVRDTRGEIY
ncbi:MAG: hypothetical protein J4G03_02790 [Gemmatimonadetes bacterium]|nr:hypothetical protein [Gemmatimonadota bacterium]